ncbi:hypothetical protein EBT25_07445, partial [bacterium]|nr:hypothetical protein [bacterium]
VEKQLPKMHELYPDLVNMKNGKPDSIAYHELPALLLAGYQQQQRTIDELATRLATLEKEYKN